MTSYYCRSLVLFSLFSSMCSYPSIAQDKPTDCSAIQYEHLNQIDPKPIEVPTVRGIAIEETGAPASRGCVVVFSDDHSRLGAGGDFYVDRSFLFANLRIETDVSIFTRLDFCGANNALRYRL